jgi:hypothetical protein
MSHRSRSHNVTRVVSLYIGPYFISASFEFPSSFMLEKCPKHRLGQIHGAPAQRGLCVRRDKSRSSSLELARNPQNPSVSIKIVPLQTECLEKRV